MKLKKEVIVYLFVCAVVQLVFVSVRLVVRGVSYAVTRRAHELSMLELGMVIIDLFIYRRLCRALIGSRYGQHGSSLPQLMIETTIYLFLLCAHLTFALFYFMLSDEPRWFALICFVCFGFYAHLAALFLLCWLMENTVAYVVPHSWLRIKTVKNLLVSERVHTLLSVVLTTAIVVVCVLSTAQPPVIRRHTVPIRRLPHQFDKFKIALLADVHIGPTVGRTTVAQIVQMVNQLEPDVIAMAGDVVDGSAHHLLAATAPMKDFKSKYGVFYATGNHEYYHGNVNEWMRLFESEYGIQSLHNKHHKIKAGSSSWLSSSDTPYLCLAGVDDRYAKRSGVPGHAMNVSAALSGCVKEAVTVLLVHQPNAAKEILDGPDGHRLDLVLSGHTHGGQMYVFWPGAWLVNAYLNGLYTHEPTGAHVYVTPGVNFWGPPIKMVNLREITLIELTADA